MKPDHLSRKRCKSFGHKTKSAADRISAEKVIWIATALADHWLYILRHDAVVASLVEKAD